MHALFKYLSHFSCHRNSLSESLKRHVNRTHTKTVKKLLTFPQVNVDIGLWETNPIMIGFTRDGSDEERVELYDALIKAGAFKYSISDTLW